MRICERCGVRVTGDREVCPLCKSVLRMDEQTAAQPEPDSYPDIAAAHRLYRKIFWVVAYFCIFAEILLVFLNYRFSPRVHWSLITGVSAAYILLTMREVLNRSIGHIRKLYVQAAAIFLVQLAIDGALGFEGWSLQYGFPCILLSLESVILLCMIIRTSDWQTYVTMQIFMAGISACYLLWSILRRGGNLVLAWVAFGTWLTFLAMTIIIGGKKAENEVLRKFHI